MDVGSCICDVMQNFRQNDQTQRKKRLSSTLAFYFIACRLQLSELGAYFRKLTEAVLHEAMAQPHVYRQPGMPKWPQSPKNRRASGVPSTACLRASSVAASAASTKKRVESLALFNRGAQRSDSRRFFAQKLFWKIE